MISYEQDPDVVRWGLQLFDGDPYSNYSYGAAIAQNGPDYYQNRHQDQYYKETIYNLASTPAQNEYNACALEEELSQLSISEPHSDIHPVIDHTQTPYYSHGWFSPPMDSYAFGNANGEEETTDAGPSSSCSSPGEGSYSEEVWSYSIEPLDEYDLEGEVGKRLNQMVPIPHIPKINGEIPSVDEATLDHQRLLDRLQMYELVESKVQGDGNCQFRALSDQFYRTTDHHKFVRLQVVNQLKSFREMYEGYVPMAYDDYLHKMSKSGEWGDHVTLQAAADLYGVKIFVITSFKGTCYIEIVPNIQKSERVIFLSFWAEVHYNSIHPEGDVAIDDGKTKKRSSVSANKQLESHVSYS
ncbi:unnamed protein product [Cuscuta campestris]|uniref:ubiquitinyl hydrolase 1 n=1 Tax=Cuscuta campestris TaxID=132261 RepID=A0A484LY52_9ASTE|nr:unnamed protein product [Cuscuta campestris]